jgi:iron complex transport system substrate-binding protein
MNSRNKDLVTVNHYWFESRLLPLFAGIFFLVICASQCFAGDDQFPTTVIDCLGREVSITAIPERIVSTVPSNTEILYDLGLKDKVVAVTSHCQLTCDVKGKQIVKGWSNIDIDRVVSLKPDLVLAFGGLQVPLIDKLDQLGITTFSFCPRTVAETFHMLEVVGEITGTKQRAEQLVQKARLKLESIRNKVKKISPEERLTFLRLISPKDVIVAGRYSFQHDIVVQAGGNNIMKGLLHNYERVEFERIKALNPEVFILNGDDEQEVKEKFLKLAGWKDLPATQKKRIKVMPCRLICHPNFDIVDVVEMLAHYLYPDLFG